VEPAFDIPRPYFVESVCGRRKDSAGEYRDLPGSGQQSTLLLTIKVSIGLHHTSH